MRITKFRRTIKDVPPDLYSFTQLSLSDINALLREIPIQNVSQWYTHLNYVTTICCHLRVKYSEGKPTGEECYPAVLPFRVCSAGMVLVCAELGEALDDLLWAINEKFFDISEPGGQTYDAENPSLCTPILFVSTRLSGLAEKKMRRIALPELFRKIKLAFEKQNPGQEDNCRLVLRTVDFKQCGLYLDATIEREFSGFVRVKITWAKLQSLVSNIQAIGDLICDLLILSNDNMLHKKFGREMNLHRVKQNSCKVSENRAVDPSLLKKAIEQAYTPSYVDSGSEREWTDNQKGDIEEAVMYQLNFLHNGFSSDCPLKVVHDFRWTFHLLNLGNGKFTAFRRRVRSVSDSGYRVRNCSFWMWVAVVIGMALPVVYIIARRREVSFEDLIGTAISLVALFIAMASPIVFQVCYRGERLSDILSNIRNIDSQEEFDTGQKHYVRQLTDILEVIRMSHSPPPFLGGLNMSYLGQRNGNLLFDAHAPILFPNLELTGFALYEDEIGEMYMIDKWSNLFEVWLRIISDHDDGTVTSTASSTTVAANANPGANLYIENATNVTQRKMNICCKTVKRKGPLKIVQGDGSSTEYIHHGYIAVGYETADGNEYQKDIFRLVPYGTRKRKVEHGGWRLQASTEGWEQVANADILVMEIGKSLFNDGSQV